MRNLTEDERSMASSAMRKYIEGFRATVERQRALVQNPDPYRSEFSKDADKQILERFYELFSALNSAYDKINTPNPGHDSGCYGALIICDCGKWCCP